MQLLQRHLYAPDLELELSALTAPYIKIFLFAKTSSPFRIILTEAVDRTVVAAARAKDDRFVELILAVSWRGLTGKLGG